MNSEAPTPEHGGNFQSIPAHCSPAAPGMGPRLQDTQLLLCTPQKPPNCSKPRPGPKSRTSAFLGCFAHNPARCPTPGHLHCWSAAPKPQTWELSLFNCRTSGKRNPPPFRVSSSPKGEEDRLDWQEWAGNHSAHCTWTTGMHFKAHHYREKGTGPSTNRLAV